MNHPEPAEIILEEESLRDGLQMESIVLSLGQKLKLFEMMFEAGLKRIQVGSFVHPEVVPQMADTDQLVQMIGEHAGITVTGLVLNDRGLQRAIDCGLQHVSMSTSISNSHSLKNFRKTSKDGLISLKEMIKRAVDSNIVVRAGIQCAFGCIHEGQFSDDLLMEAVGSALEAGADEINLADTSGTATPFMVKQIIKTINLAFPETVISLHLHDSRGLAMANLFAGYEAGVRIFDTCIGGLGGCPFVQGAAGNLATEDVVNMFHTSGIATGIDLQSLCAINNIYNSILNKELPGRICRVHKACHTNNERKQ